MVRIALFLGAVAPSVVQAQVLDHLKCYKVKDPQARIHYTADLSGLLAEPGCTIKIPADIVCVPATKANVVPTPPRSGGTGPTTTFGCYKVKCPKTILPTLTLDDQFGDRTVTPSKSDLLCAPVSRPCTGALIGGYCWFLGAQGEDCDEVCAAHDRVYDLATASYAGSGGTDANCAAITAALDPSATFQGATTGPAVGLGCFDFSFGGPGIDTFRVTSPPTEASASNDAVSRFCACY